MTRSTPGPQQPAAHAATAHGRKAATGKRVTT